MTVQSQIYAFLVTIYGGFVLGFMYDIFKVAQRVFKLKKSLINIADIIFWILGTIIMLYFMYLSNYVEVRFYSFLGFAIGALLYYLLLSYFILQGLIAFYHFMVKIFSRIARIIEYPFRVLIGLFYVPYRFIRKVLSLPKKIIEKNLTYFKIFRKKK